MSAPESVTDPDMDILAVIKAYGDRYLIMDGRVPLMTRSRVQDEFRLYRLSSGRREMIRAHFSELTGRNLSADTMTDELSGGQKAVLGALIALASPAPRILFVRFFDALHPDRRRRLRELIRSGRFSRTEIRELP